MKIQSLKKIGFIALLCGSFGLMQSCVTEDSDDNNPTDSLRKTGWQGSDDPTVIPQNVTLPDFDGNGSNLPTSIDLTQYLPPIGDQGQYGTCVAWASAYNCKTALEAIKFGLTPAQLQSDNAQMSAKYLFTALENSKKGDDCNGTDFTPAMDVMLNKGVATKATVPYTNLGNCSQSSLDPSWDADAALHKIKYYRRIPSNTNATKYYTSIKQALAAKIPVVLGAKLDDSFMDWNSEAVYQSATSTARVGIHSYHALCIVGYDDSKGPRGAFKVVNSWSNQWGTNGFIWVDYVFMVNGFAFGSNPDMPNEKNLFVAVNDEQVPAINPNPPTPTGVDLAPWIDDDYYVPDSCSTCRNMEFNIYNLGTVSAAASSNWGYAYIYYNAYNANDYGVVFYDDFANVGAYRSYSYQAYPATATTPEYGGFTINCNIPADGDLAKEWFNDDVGIRRTYPMPTNLSGEYYLVLVVDVNDKFLETDESDNLFYTTLEPKTFTNGIGDRRNVASDNFKNILLKSDIRTTKALKYRTAVTSKNRNAYTPDEIIGFLKKEAKNGKLAQRIAIAKQDKSARKGSISGIHGK